jgi:hypothetical protein
VGDYAVIAWVQNADIADAIYWMARGTRDESGGIAEWTFGVKRHMARKWDTRLVLIGLPKATERHSTAELVAMGVCGLYAERI